MKNLKFLICTLAFAFICTSFSKASPVTETKQKTELVKQYAYDVQNVELSFDAPQIPTANISQPLILPVVELWNFSRPKFTIVNPVKICENQKATNFKDSDTTDRNPDNPIRLC